MKVISSGNTYEIFDDTLRVYEKLPAQNYIVRFSKFKGFYLDKYTDIQINEDKVYGVHTTKADKVLRTFANMNRSLGVILSGDKGIGKSLFAKLLAVKAKEQSIPLIVVDKYITGIASYLESIDQEVMVLFDEFDKTFGGITAKDGEANPQTELLSLFDGVSAGKKLFVITCNNLQKISDFFVNRPGRFHYHFRFEYPTAEEIRQYLSDKLHKQYHDQIQPVIDFSIRVDLNYDCLRAIAFEINNGNSFKETISDLNIIKTNHCSKFNVALRYKNGMLIRSHNESIDLSSNSSKTINFVDDKFRDICDIVFYPQNIKYNDTKNVYYVECSDLILTYEDDENELIDKFKQSEVDCLELVKVPLQTLHYVV